MSLLDLAQWILAIGRAAIPVVLVCMLVWWFADYDGFNRRFSSLPHAAQVIMSIFLLLPVATRALEGDHWATAMIVLAMCFLGIAIFIRARQRRASA